MNIENEQVKEEFEELGARDIHEIYGLDDQLAIVRIGSTWTIIDRMFRVISRKDYDRIGRTMNGELVVAQKGEGFTFINSSGDEIIAPVDNAWAFENGIALVNNHGKYYFIDKAGDKKGPKFDFITKYSTLTRRYGLLTYKGSAKEHFENGSEFLPYQGWLLDYAIILLGKHQGVIDRNAQVVLEPCYDCICIDAIHQESGYIPVELNNRWGYVDLRTGEECVPIHYDEGLKATVLSDCTKLAIDRKLGLVDQHGRQLCPFEFDRIGNFVEGYAIVRVNGKYGYLREKDYTLIDEVRYASAYPFYKGYGEVTLKGILGYKKRFIDGEGRLFKRLPR